MNYYNLYDFLNLCSNGKMYNFPIKSKLQQNPKITFKYIILHLVTCLTLALRFVIARLKSVEVHLF